MWSDVHQVWDLLLMAPTACTSYQAFPFVQLVDKHLPSHTGKKPASQLPKQTNGCPRASQPGPGCGRMWGRSERSSELSWYFLSSRRSRMITERSQSGCISKGYPYNEQVADSPDIANSPMCLWPQFCSLRFSGLSQNEPKVNLAEHGNEQVHTQRPPDKSF